MKYTTYLFDFDYTLAEMCIRDRYKAGLTEQRNGVIWKAAKK